VEDKWVVNSLSDTWLYIVSRGRKDGGKKRPEGIGREEEEKIGREGFALFITPFDSYYLTII
jgi:hypothetical protein